MLTEYKKMKRFVRSHYIPKQILSQFLKFYFEDAIIRVTSLFLFLLILLETRK